MTASAQLIRVTYYISHIHHPSNKPQIDSYSRWPNPTSILTCTLGMTGTMRLRFLIVVLLLGRALLVPSAATNLPFRSRLWWAEWCSTSGRATTTTRAGGEAKAAAQQRERVARTMSPLEEARHRDGMWRRARGSDGELMGQIGDEKGAVKWSETWEWNPPAPLHLCM